MRTVLVALAALLAVPVVAQEIECENGAAHVPDVGVFPCDGVALVGYLPVEAFATDASPAANANNDVWGWTDPVTGTEYALVGTENGTAFVDLSVPSRPRFVGKLPTTTYPSTWRDIKVYGDYAFVVADVAGEHGMQVFDLRRLRSVSGEPVTFTADAVYNGIGSAHNLVVNEETGFAYAVGSRPPQDAGFPVECTSRGFHAINIQDPTSPVFAGCFSDALLDTDPYIIAGYTHDAQCVVYRGPDSDYTGREICLGANEDVVTIFDVTDKSDVRVVSMASYPNAAYTHQGWLTEDQRYFLVNDELDEQNRFVQTQRTIVFDLADLDAPEVAFIYDSGLTTIDHNLYIRSGFAFESNYEAGLRILDLSAISEGAITEVGFFDTYPASNTVSFNGQWSNYPYFESGIVVANDRDNGLFVLRPDVLAVSTGGGPRASAAHLSEPVPNPTASGARLTLRVEADQTVRADLYDVAGRRVRSLYEGPVTAGVDLSLVVLAEGLPAGVYLVRVVGERFEETRRLALSR